MQDSIDGPQTCSKALRSRSATQLDDAAALEGLAETYAARGEPGRATSYLSRLAEQAQESGNRDRIVSLNMRLGEIWERWLSDPDAAAARYRTVLEFEPRHRAARLRLAISPKGEAISKQLRFCMKRSWWMRRSVTPKRAWRIGFGRRRVLRAPGFGREVRRTSPSNCCSKPLPSMGASRSTRRVGPTSAQEARLGSLVDLWEEAACFRLTAGDDSYRTTRSSPYPCRRAARPCKSTLVFGADARRGTGP